MSVNPQNAEAISKAWRATVWAACVTVVGAIEPAVITAIFHTVQWLGVAVIVCATFLLTREGRDG